MGNNYENANTLNPQVDDANLDKGEDGLTNLEEFQSGRNPTVNEGAVMTIINRLLQEE